MKQQTVNEFKEGLNLDLHPLVTPKTVLTDNINGTFITYNGNEFCLQNDRGNKKVAELTPGYTPIGIKEHNGILYIVSVNGDKTEIGTYPSLGETDKNGTILTNTNFYDLELIIEDEYKALKIGENHSLFTDVELGYDIKHPVTIEIQDSYDGSVNLILVADGKATKIINSGFSKLTDTTGKWIKRSQTVDTNVYHLTDENKLNQEINLIRTSTTITNIDLLGVQSGGQFKGGNYTFYIKFGDADYNQTDVVAESGIVSIFNGNDGIPSTISGTLLDERTDKMINLRILGLNPVYSKIYIYYSREYSDSQGYRMTEYGMFSEPIDMDYDENRTDLTWDNATYQDIWLTGFEQTSPIEPELLNVDYHTVDWARAEAQHSNMLFLGNVGQEETFKLYDSLKSHALSVSSKLAYGSGIGKVNLKYTNLLNSEYYSTQNIYHYLGYWPNEYYRFGLVYILSDGSTTPVFNITGYYTINYENGIFVNDQTTSNEFGIFKTPNVNILAADDIKPLCFQFNVPLYTDEEFASKVKGYFIVRQKRIPITICQGLSIGVDGRSHTPLTYYNETENGIVTDEGWMTESFLSVRKAMDYTSVDLSYANSGIIYSGEKIKEIESEFQASHAEYAAFELMSWSFGPNGIVGDIKQARTNTLNTYLQNNQEIQLTSDDYYGEYEEVPQYDGLEIMNFIINTKLYKVLYKWNSETKQFDELQNPFYFIVDYCTYNETSWDERINIGNESFKVYTTTNLQNIQAYAQMWNNQIEINLDYDASGNVEEPKFIRETSSANLGWGLISLDPMVNYSVGGTLDGSIFDVKREYGVNFNMTTYLHHGYEISDFNDENATSSKAVYVAPNTNMKVIGPYAFSNIAGNSATVSSYKYTKDVNLVAFKKEQNGMNLYWTVPKKSTNVNQNSYNTTKNINLLRGNFTPFVGIASEFTLEQDETLGSKIGIYSIRNKDLENSNIVREQDKSEYYAVSNRTDVFGQYIDVYRGDCYTSTVAIRVIRNFIDQVAPVAETILEGQGWSEYVVSRDKDAVEDDKRLAYEKVNLSDVNTVSLGYWVVFKCLSSYNLGLRCKDSFHTDEVALLGSERSFFPLNGGTVATGNKMEESYLLNDGLSATVGRKRYNLMPDVPYSKSEFSNRIMFSNVNVADAFTNGYRTFQGLSYKDYDKQYGAITKLISLGQNIFVVMEHGLGLVPVNPKALMQTTTGEAIHIYGYGVLPDEMTIISQDYGSKYEHSVIRTPIGIYGVDVDAKKIWRFSDKQGFETISDMKIETYLKDFLSSRQIEMGTSDIRTHYNGKKGDLMFAWYPKADENPAYMICYNERQNIWTTKYDWYPTVSENINDEFYSLNNEAIWDHAENVGYNNTHVSSWYDNNHKFEFEFVVSDPVGVNKVFDNLQIISNNVQPDEMEITVIGDDYVFKRTPVDLTSGHKERGEYEDVLKIHTTSNIHGDLESTQIETEHSPKGYYCFDKRLNQSALTKWQPFKDMYKFGRRVGNIQYKEGSWFAQIEPLLITDKRLVAKEARIRDKWAKIRIRYSGKDLAIITAIKTLINI